VKCGRQATSPLQGKTPNVQGPTAAAVCSIAATSPLLCKTTNVPGPTAAAVCSIEATSQLLCKTPNVQGPTAVNVPGPTEAAVCSIEATLPLLYKTSIVLGSAEAGDPAGILPQLCLTLTIGPLAGGVLHQTATWIFRKSSRCSESSPSSPGGEALVASQPKFLQRACTGTLGPAEAPGQALRWLSKGSELKRADPLPAWQQCALSRTEYR
jgi:hypothetical protein